MSDPDSLHVNVSLKEPHEFIFTPGTSCKVSPLVSSVARSDGSNWSHPWLFGLHAACLPGDTAWPSATRIRKEEGAAAKLSYYLSGSPASQPECLTCALYKRWRFPQPESCGFLKKQTSITPCLCWSYGWGWPQWFQVLHQ